MSATAKAAIGLLLTLLMGWIAHGPLGAGARLVDGIERRVDAAVDRQGVTGVGASLGRDPLSRHVRLTGPADDFQRRGFANLVRPIEGVSGVSWDARAPAPSDAAGRNPRS